MGHNPEALYQCLVNDVQHFLERDQEIAARLGGTPQSYPDSDPDQLACVQLLNSFYKKYNPSTGADADKKALDKFTESNRLCKDLVISPCSELENLLLGCWKQRIWELFDDMPHLDYSSLFERGGFGNGMNRKSKDESIYQKLFSSRLTASNKVLSDIYLSKISSDPRWKSAEFCRQLFFGAPLLDQGSLSFVPKTRDVSRTICTEPVLNTFFQKGLCSVLEERLRAVYSLDFTIQPNLNRALARQGSISGSHATIDLTSASDSVSVRLMKYFPRPFQLVLSTLRTPRAFVPGNKSVQMWMVSTMGNAFTFPLETAIFTCVVHAVYDSYSVRLPRIDRDVIRQGKHTDTWGVFGDDIVLPNYMFGRCITLLKLLGFRPNVDKSFCLGSFRESCGVEFYQGLDVRGVFIKRLSGPADVYVAANLLMRWSAKHNISLKTTVRYLLRSLSRVNLVPRAEDLSAGFHVPLCCIKRKTDRNGSYLYQSYDPVPRRVSLRPLVKGTVDRLRYSIRNPSGLHLFYLNGGLRNDAYVLPSRDEVPRRFVKKLSLYWDAISLGDDLLDRSGWLRWSSESLRVMSAL